MGRKYGSLHIRVASSNKETITIINDCITAMDAGFCSDVEKVASLLGLDLDKQQIPLLNQIVRAGMSFRAKQTTVEHSGFLSVYDQRVTFENVREIAQRVSAVLNLPVLFASVYDGDVFVFGLCEEGKIVASHISGDCEVYGMERKNDNIEGLEQYLANGAKNIPELKNLSGKDFESALSETLGFRLDAK